MTSKVPSPLLSICILYLLWRLRRGCFQARKATPRGGKEGVACGSWAAGKAGRSSCSRRSPPAEDATPGSLGPPLALALERGALRQPLRGGRRCPAATPTRAGPARRLGSDPPGGIGGADLPRQLQLPLAAGAGAAPARTSPGIRAGQGGLRPAGGSPRGHPGFLLRHENASGKRGYIGRLPAEILEHIQDGVDVLAVRTAFQFRLCSGPSEDGVYRFLWLPLGHFPVLLTTKRRWDSDISFQAVPRGEGGSREDILREINHQRIQDNQASSHLFRRTGC